MQFKWTPNFFPNKIYIFGCGGTGSRVVPLIAQFIKSCPWVIDPELILIDFDAVEEKNLIRQNFIMQDVGKNKATVLATRYSRAFNLPITPIPHKVTRDYSGNAENAAYTKVAEMLRTSMGRNNAFILCVDSPDARRDIVKTIMGMTNFNAENILIDAGNENDFGQVVLSSLASIYTNHDAHSLLFKLLKEEALVSGDLPSIPVDSGYFDNMIATSTPSCADLDQTMAINTLMAVNIFGIIQNIFYVKPIMFHRLSISMQHGAIPQYMNLKYLQERYTERSTHANSSSTLSRHSVANIFRGRDIYHELSAVYSKQVEIQKMIENASKAAEPVEPAKKKEVKPGPVSIEEALEMAARTI